MTGFHNVIAGLEHFPSHVRDWLTNSDSPIAKELIAVFDELAAYEKAHEKEQIQAIEAAALQRFKDARAAGSTVGQSIIAAVAAAFATGLADVKTMSTQAMTAWVAGLVK